MKTTDWEVELGIIIGKAAKYVAVEDAYKHITGYCVVNDIVQNALPDRARRPVGQRSRGCDTFNPIGPPGSSPPTRSPTRMCSTCGSRWTASATEDGSTRTMIFDVPTIVSYTTSSWAPADQGRHFDRHATRRRPRPEAAGLSSATGQTMRLAIAGLGEQQQTTVAAA